MIQRPRNKPAAMRISVKSRVQGSNMSVGRQAGQRRPELDPSTVDNFKMIVSSSKNTKSTP